MKQTVWVYRILFACICLLFVLFFQKTANASIQETFIMGVSSLAALAIIEAVCRMMRLDIFLTLVLSLIIGAITATAFATTLKSMTTLFAFSLEQSTINSAVCIAYLSTLYASLLLFSKLKDNWWNSLPLAKEEASSTAKHKIIIDQTSLEDQRLVELAKTGFLSYQLIIPSFIMADVQSNIDSHDDAARNRARKSHEHIKRLEAISYVHVQALDLPYSIHDDIATRLYKMAKKLNCPILTVDQAQYRIEENEVLIICLENIAGILKPSAQRGEILLMKVQRLGKEPKQGVGYLDDGTMVVINGGGEHLGQTIKAQVLSQKYSSSGKIIFCNAVIPEGQIPLERNGSTLAESPYQQPVTSYSP